MDLSERKHRKKTYHRIPIPLSGDHAFLLEENIVQGWNTNNPGLETLQDIADALGHKREVRLEGSFLDIESKDYHEFMSLFLRINDLRTGTLEGKALEEIDPKREKFFELIGDGTSVMSEQEAYDSVKSQFGDVAHKVVRDVLALKKYNFNKGDRVIERATLKPLYVPTLGNHTFIDLVKTKKNFQTGNIALETLQDIAVSRKYDKPIILEGDFLDVNQPAYLDFMNLVLNVEGWNRVRYDVSIDGPARMVEAYEQLKDRHGDEAYKVVAAIYGITDKTLTKAKKLVGLAKKHNVISVSGCVMR